MVQFLVTTFLRQKMSALLIVIILHNEAPPPIAYSMQRLLTLNIRWDWKLCQSFPHAWPIQIRHFMTFVYGVPEVKSVSFHEMTNQRHWHFWKMPTTCVCHSNKNMLLWTVSGFLWNALNICMPLYFARYFYVTSKLQRHQVIKNITYAVNTFWFLDEKSRVISIVSVKTAFFYLH